MHYQWRQSCKTFRHNSHSATSPERGKNDCDHDIRNISRHLSHIHSVAINQVTMTTLKRGQDFNITTKNLWFCRFLIAVCSQLSRVLSLLVSSVLSTPQGFVASCQQKLSIKEIVLFLSERHRQLFCVLQYEADRVVYATSFDPSSLRQIRSGQLLCPA